MRSYSPQNAEIGILCEYGPDIPELRDCDEVHGSYFEDKYGVPAGERKIVQPITPEPPKTSAEPDNGGEKPKPGERNSFFD